MLIINKREIGRMAVHISLKVKRCGRLESKVGRYLSVDEMFKVNVG